MTNDKPGVLFMQPDRAEAEAAMEPLIEDDFDRAYWQSDGYFSYFHSR